MEQIVNFNNKIVILGLGTTSRCLVDVIDRHIKCPLENITILEPGEASDKDLYDLPPEQLEGIPTVCGSLREALVALENDHDFLLAGDVFTKDQLRGYMDLKWEEVNNYEHTPHPVEYSMYYSC